MKRILSSILLLFVLTLSVHPVITLHFCKGDLHSFTVIQENESMGCCISSEINDNNFDTLSINLTESSESCCSFQKVEILTDNFTVEHTNSTIQKPIAFSYISLSAIVDYLIHLFTPEAITKSNIPISPLGLHSTTLQFLSYICVYRL